MNTILSFILFLGCGVTFFMYYITLQKLQKNTIQMKLLIKQNSKLSSEMSFINKNSTDIRISSLSLQYSVGEATSNCSLYLGPTLSSPILRNVTLGTKVSLLDFCSSSDNLWYEVKLIINDTVNIKGYIRKEFIKEINTIDTSTNYLIK